MLLYSASLHLCFFCCLYSMKYIYILFNLTYMKLSSWILFLFLLIFLETHTERVASKLLGPFPNTYTLTKHCAELKVAGELWFPKNVVLVSTMKYIYISSILHIFTVFIGLLFFFYCFYKHMFLKMIVFVVSLPIKYILYYMSISDIYINYLMDYSFFFLLFLENTCFRK